MQHQSHVVWKENLRFDAHQNGKVLPVDGNQNEAESTGFRPKALILTSLAGCTGIDVIEILKKMRVEFSEFSMDVKADMTEEHPKVYTKIYLTYNIRLMQADDQTKMEKAVALSQEKYCGVSAMVRQFAPIEVNINYL